MKANPLLKAAQTALDPLRAAGTALPTLIPTTGKGSVVSLRFEIEGVHFDPTFLTPFDLGQKAMSVTLFELAAAGNKPRRVQVSAGVNQATTETFLEEIFRGMQKVADRFKVRLGFGGSVHSPTSFFLSLLTFSDKTGALLLPKEGDKLAVLGTMGAATAGLNALRRFGWTAVKDYAEVVRAHLCPNPPLQACLELRAARLVTSTAASVDGASGDIHRLCESLGLGARIVEEKIPISAGTREAASYLSVNVRRWALFGGEDYGLFVTVPQRNWTKVQARCKKLGVSLTEFGELLPAKEGVCLLNLEGEKVSLANKSWNPLVRRKVEKL